MIDLLDFGSTTLGAFSLLDGLCQMRGGTVWGSQFKPVLLESAKTALAVSLHQGYECPCSSCDVIWGVHFANSATL
jgi:hypothetical protein